MRNTLLFCLVLFLSVTGYSQSAPCLVTNNINSGTVRVQLTASKPGTCFTYCTQTVCIFPGATVAVPPCGPSGLVWSSALVIPTTDDCSFPCPFPTWTTVSPTFCGPLFGFNVHCHAGFYSANFVGPNQLDIN